MRNFPYMLVVKGALHARGEGSGARWPKLPPNPR